MSLKKQILFLYMEAEVGTPIEYNPDEFMNKNSDELEERNDEHNHNSLGQ